VSFAQRPVKSGVEPIHRQLQGIRPTFGPVRIQPQYSELSCHLKFVPTFYLSSTGYGIASKALVVDQALNCYGIFYYKVCNIVDAVKAALLANSYAIIVAHNHPAGSLTPSPEDLDVTKTLIKAGNLLGVPVVDHIIVSSNGLSSLRETHSHLWQK
jgi:hypothetical protein